MALTIASRSADQATAREPQPSPVLLSLSLPLTTGLDLIPAGHGFPGNPGSLPLQDQDSFLPAVSTSPPTQSALIVPLMYRDELSKNPAMS